MRVNPVFSGSAKIAPSFTRNYSANDAQAIAQIFREHKSRIDGWPKNVSVEIHSAGERGNAWENGDLHAFAKIKVGAHSFDRGDQDLWRQDGESIRKYVERLIRFVEETHEFL